MKKNIFVVIAILLAVVVSGIVYAASDKAKDDAAEEIDVDAQATTEPAAKNMTYGQCVSENAAIKNSCYATVKTTLTTCKEQAAQDLTKKDTAKQCKQTYKKDKKQCKTVFKASKQECKKIKHNFLETVQYAFK